MPSLLLLPVFVRLEVIWKVIGHLIVKASKFDHLIVNASKCTPNNLNSTGRQLAAPILGDEIIFAPLSALAHLFFTKTKPLTAN